MARGQAGLLDPLRRLIGRQGGSALTDGELLERYVANHDAAAFEVLVWRHGAMVLALCRRVLRDDHEAEDAFQATFLVFARKAGTVGRGEAVGSWLYKVAYRVSLRLRDRAANRPEPVAEPAEPIAPEQPDDVAWRDLRPVLDAEIAALPEKYRAPFILCYLQGQTNEEAAALLGCPKGTVLSRLSRGREWLRERLTRRGLTPAAVALVLNLPGGASAAVPAGLVQSAVGTAGGAAPVHVTALAESVMRTMVATKLKSAAALVALAVLGTGISWAATGLGEPGDRPAAAARDRPARPAPEQPAREGGELLRGPVIAVAKGGKSFTMQLPPQPRGDEPKQVVVKLGEKTTATYNGVGTNAAAPAEGYGAEVRLENGNDVAATVVFTGPFENPRRQNIGGKVVEIAKDGKGVTLAIPVTRSGPPRADDVHRFPIGFDDKTVVVFNNVDKDGAKITKGYSASVWYTDDMRVGGNPIAGKVTFTGDAVKVKRDDPEPDLVGKVVRAGDKAFALELPPAARGEEPKRVPVKIAERTAVSFHNVGPDEAKLVVGLQARVWLAEKSEDTAARIAFTGTVPERWTVIPGKVVAVRQQKDGVMVTVEQPPTARGEEPKRTEVLITPATKVAYFGIGPGEAKPVEGLQANIRLLDGSKDTAGQATFSKPRSR